MTLSTNCKMYSRMFRKHIKKVKYLFDDSAVQYKNYKRFMNLCHHYTILIRKTGGLFFWNPSWKIFF